MAKAKKVTISDILAKKKVIEEKKAKPFYSQLFEGEIEVEDISINKISDIIQSADKSDPIRADYELVYACCPIFRNKELHEEFEVSDPIDVIGKIYGSNISELSELTEHILSRYGLYLENGIEKIKKQ